MQVLQKNCFILHLASPSLLLILLETFALPHRMRTVLLLSALFTCHAVALRSMWEELSMSESKVNQQVGQCVTMTTLESNVAEYRHFTMQSTTIQSSFLFVLFYKTPQPRLTIKPSLFHQKRQCSQPSRTICIATKRHWMNYYTQSCQ